MVLSSSQHILLAVSLALCLCFLVPRMMGGGGGETSKKDPGRVPPSFRGHAKESPGKMRQDGSAKAFSNMEHAKSAMEQELKSESTGTGRSMTFALMPLYAVGVAVFAAYKFSKVKSKEKSKSESMEEQKKKEKETEGQLMELERHLSQTEQMLNSILTQLDPLSNCVNTLAFDQKNEIMNQLQSIRQLMKKSGINKSPHYNSDQSCENKLEDLIHSFETQQSGVDENVETEESAPDMECTSVPAHDPVKEQSSLNASVDLCEDEDSAQPGGADATASPVSEGLRKRNV